MPVTGRQYEPHPIESVSPVIAIIDIDSFECQLYQRDKPHTKGLPCAVVNQGGRLVSNNYEAKSMGVNRNDTPYLWKAKGVCPRLHIFDKPDKYEKQDNTKCRAGTYEVTKCIENFLKDTYPEVMVQVVSSDEIFLNITSVVTKRHEEFETLRSTWPPRKAEGAAINIPHGIVWERASEQRVGPMRYKVPHKPKEGPCGMMVSQKSYAYKNEERLIYGADFMREIGSHLKKTTGLYSSAGVSSNKLLAKIACGLNKPMKVTAFPEESLKRIGENLAISSVPGLGGQIGETLKEVFKVEKMSEILKIDFTQLEEVFGKEKAQEVYSRAMGKDETPVVHKLYKDKITCNKPRDDIRTMRRLRVVLHYLYLEIMVIVGEENKRWGRTCEEAVVSWKLDSYEVGLSEVFRIRSRIGTLEKRVFQAIKSAEGFDPTSFSIVELSFSLRNWIPINIMSTSRMNLAEGDSSEDESEVTIDGVQRKISASSSNSAAISEDSGFCAPRSQLSDRLRVRSELPEIIPEFNVEEVLGSFRINKDLTCSVGEDVAIPTLLPNEQLTKLKGYKLLKHYNFKTSPPSLVMDYTKFNTRKHEYFSQWLKDNDVSLDGIHFVCFMGRLLRPLKTIENKTHGDWSMYGMNANGVIYLWDEKCNRSVRRSCKDEITYAGFLFEHLITGNDQEGANVDGITKAFPIQKAKFGKHRLLMLGHADAQDEDGGLVQATIHLDARLFYTPNPSLVTERKMKVWAQAVVSGAKSVVIGMKDMANVVRGVQHISLEELSAQLDDHERKLSFVFLHRLLDWIKEHLPASDPKLVKRFAWVPTESGKVHCSIEPLSEVEKLLVPKIYFNTERSSPLPPVGDDPEAKTPKPKASRRRARGSSSSQNSHSKKSTQTRSSSKGDKCSVFSFYRLLRAILFICVMTIVTLQTIFRCLSRKNYRNVIVYSFLLVVVCVLLCTFEVDHLKHI